MCFSVALANNIQVTNASLVGHDPTQQYRIIQFDVSWENSWRTSTLESNWDAAWIFAKYRITAVNGSPSYSPWYHCRLHDSGHTTPTGATMDIGLMNTDLPYNATTNYASGVFLYRNANGTGNVNFTGAQLRWNYGGDLPFVSFPDDSLDIEVCVFAIEMVYVPQGAFYVGDNVFGTTPSQRYFRNGNNTSPFQITSESALNIGTAAGQLWASDAIFTSAGPFALPAEYPKGYNAFYCMKYELSQGMYMEFANRLTRTQQGNRINITTVGRYYANAATPQYRNGIKLIADPGGTSPRVFGCDLNNDGTPNGAADGQYIACNYISWNDLRAFADWAGLRPISTLEYEKACRGTLNAVEGEFAWRTISYTNATGISNSGANNEAASNAGANVVFNNHASVQGPMRTGCFAGPATNREQSGGTYYGIMEMSGNLWEYVIDLRNNENWVIDGLFCLNSNTANSRNFNRNRHGDGTLDSNGDSDVATWSSGAEVLRGGAWNSTDPNFMRMSNRYASSFTIGVDRYVNYYTTGRTQAFGARLVRTDRKSVV